MKNETSIFAALETDVLNAGLGEMEKAKILRNIQQLKKEKINLLITGATGVGKAQPSMRCLMPMCPKWGKHPIQKPWKLAVMTSVIW